MALEDCDCSRRSATRARSRLMGTRCSGRSPRLTLGGATCGSACATAAATVIGATAKATATGGAAGVATAASTSPLVTRPSRPVPATLPTAIWFSAISLAAEGIATAPSETERGVPTADGGALPGAGAAPGAVAAATARPSVSIRAINCSAATTAPSACTNSSSRPEAGAGTSSTTLSVSTSISISSTVTMSPTCFFHCCKVASATDSDNCGTLTSTIAIALLSTTGVYWLLL